MATMGDSTAVVSGYLCENEGKEIPGLRPYTFARSADLEDKEGIEVAGAPSEDEKIRKNISKADILCSIM